MEFDGWVAGYKVRAFPWIDGRRIYYNVQYYAPGQSLARPPAWDKTIFITDDAAGRLLVENFKDTLTAYVAGLRIKENTETTITVTQVPFMFS